MKNKLLTALALLSMFSVTSCLYNPSDSPSKQPSTEQTTPEISESLTDNSTPSYSSPIDSSTSIDSSIPSESSTPESSTPESSTPEISTPESSTPESSTPESSTPESSTPESSTPESSTPESSTPESSTPEDSSDSDNPIIVAADLSIYVLEMAGIYGDSIYLKQGDIDILIDAGWDTDGAYVRDFVDEYCTDDVLDLLVVTHPHGDHVGGMATALTNVDTITNIIDYGTFASTPTSSENGLAAYETLKKEYIKNGTKYSSAYAAVNGGQKTLTFNSDFSVEVLNTGNYYTNGVASTADPNGHSVSLLFKYKDFTFLTQGDLNDEQELSLMQNENLPEVTMYKASHHASNGSNARAFLDKINPKEVIISASRALSYNNRTDTSTNKEATSGHPSADAVGRIYATKNIKENLNVYWNMYAGTMKFTTKGEDVAVPLEGFGPERLGYYEKVNGQYVKVTGEENKKFHETKVFKARGYDKYLNQSGTPDDGGEVIPPSTDYENIEYSSHSDYITCAEGSQLKVIGVVTATNGKNTAFLQNGTEGYYVYDKSVVPTLEYGKTYTLVGSKLMYNGIREISSIVYTKEETSVSTYQASDVSSLDFTSVTEMANYHGSVVSFKEAAIIDIPTNLSSYTRTSYTISAKIDDKTVKVSVDQAYLGEEVFKQTLVDFASLVVGQKISFEAIISVKSSTNEFIMVNPDKLTSGGVSTQAIITNAINSVVVTGTVQNGTNKITLPTSVTGSDVVLSWASSNEDVISSTGVVTATTTDTVVTLTLTATLNGESLTKTYTVCVIGQSSNAKLAYTEDFTHANNTNSGSYGGSGIKPGYADGTAVFNPGYEWTLNNALHGASASDKHYTGPDSNDIWCLRVKPTSARENSCVYTNFAFENLQYVDFYYAAYGSYTGTTLKVYYSIDNGATWVYTNQSFAVGSTSTYGRAYINQTAACMVKFVFENESSGATSSLDQISFFVSE